MEQKNKVYKTLEECGIQYHVVEHPAVYTIEEMDALETMIHKEAIVKNLFLRDAKGKKHFLVVLGKHKKADLKRLREQLESSPLSFASEDRLMKYLNLTKGAVTPFGIINDSQREVEVVIDRSLVGKDILGVHPNDNTATVFLSYEDLINVIETHGNKVRQVDFED